MQIKIETENKHMIDSQQVFTLAPQVLFTSFGQGGIIFDLGTRESRHLNPTAANVIGLLNGRRNVRAIIDMLSMENDVKVQVLKEDVARFLIDVTKRGWINEA